MVVPLVLLTVDEVAPAGAAAPDVAPAPAVVEAAGVLAVPMWLEVCVVDVWVVVAAGGDPESFTTTVEGLAGGVGGGFTTVVLGVSAGLSSL